MPGRPLECWPYYRLPTRSGPSGPAQPQANQFSGWSVSKQIPVPPVPSRHCQRGRWHGLPLTKVSPEKPLAILAGKSLSGHGKVTKN